MQNKKIDKVAVVGLGYVGLPLAVALSNSLEVLGLDISERRVEELKKGHDINNESTSQELKSSKITYSTDFSKLSDYKFIIVTVPTPVDANKRPDLSFLALASKSIGKYLQEESIVVYESTVYPGVTEEYCMPILEKYSGLKYGTDFNVGYSPERINPGDKVHTVENVIKIIAGDSDKTLNIMEEVYTKVVKVGVYKAASIKTAEMAKVIENTQRDINIALMNEIALICQKLEINTLDVLNAARTKWNFLPYSPGLVGGHCIGIDPYYLTFKCEELNYHPQMILSGRRINDSIGKYIAETAIKKLISNDKLVRSANVLIMGATFKEDIKDIRNSKVLDIVEELRDYNVNVFLNDPYAEPEHVKKEFKTDLVNLKNIQNMDCIIFAVQHKPYMSLESSFLR
ncbi:MAG: nucleotide sugar dehydrogenase, partial [Candidatus Sericytochromatia bacterium]|nr:nucleotide sugar dehydrogenase [Candidatus Sericytochromatia bacterium]